MKLTLKRFEEKEWEAQLIFLNINDVFGSIQFLNTIATTYQVGISYYGVFRNGHPILLLAYFEKKKKIVFPNHYFFQFVWQNSKADEWTAVEAWELLLNKMTNGFQKIKLRLPVHNSDIRPFNWSGFSYTFKHTYIKNLDQLDYHHNIDRILAKQQLGFEFKDDGKVIDCFPIHAANLKKLLFKKTFVNNLAHWLLAMEKLGLLKIFAVKNEDKVVASIISLVDWGSKKAYFPLISKPNSDIPKEISAQLYDFSFRNLQQLGIKQVDLYGADMKSIARFKAKFNPELASFYEVEYHAGKQVIDLLTEGMKQKIKQILR